MAEGHAPIFIIGRQHCGNTMLATMLGRHADVYASTGEGNFFEQVNAIQTGAPEERRERVVREIAHGADPVLGKELQRTIRSYLRDAVDCQASEELYAKGKAFLAAQNGAERWVQKATSYVFHTERILEAFPDAKLLFLVRNPLDLAASVHRRGYFWNHIARTVWGWNAGGRRALRWAEERPSAFQIYRYEDIVRQPEKELRRITDFCGLSFSSSCLEVPHVNPSENPYAQASDETGATTSRVFYYPDVLSPVNEMAVRTLVDEDRLFSLYPDLPDPQGTFGWKSRQRAGVLVGASLLAATRQHARMLLQDPGHTVRRLKKRLLGA